MSNLKRSVLAAGAASALAIVATSGAAFAQDSMNKDHDQKAKNAHNVELAAKDKASLKAMAKTFGVSELNDIEDWKIMNGGEELGEIDRLGVDRKTGEVLAVVGLEGVIGANMKEVAIPLTKLKMAGEETLSTDLTKEQLQQRRDIDPWDGTYSQVLNDSTSR
jgi:hypothetical protein